MASALCGPGCGVGTLGLARAREAGGGSGRPQQRRCGSNGSQRGLPVRIGEDSLDRLGNIAAARCEEVRTLLLGEVEAPQLVHREEARRGGDGQRSSPWSSVMQTVRQLVPGSGLAVLLQRNQGDL